MNCLSIKAKNHIKHDGKDCFMKHTKDKHGNILLWASVHSLSRMSGSQSLWGQEEKQHKAWTQFSSGNHKELNSEWWTLKHLRELQESCRIGRYLQVQKGKWVSVNKSEKFCHCQGEGWRIWCGVAMGTPCLVPLSAWLTLSAWEHAEPSAHKQSLSMTGETVTQRFDLRDELPGALSVPQHHWCPRNNQASPLIWSRALVLVPHRVYCSLLFYS